MAWRSHGKNNAELVRNLRANNIIKSDVVENAMLAVDRGKYATFAPYHDSPQSIGFQATISAPHMHAHALEKLKDHLVEGENALDVGSGSGYLTACMAMMVGKSGRVVGIDHIPELVALATSNIKKDNPALLSSKRVKLIEASYITRESNIRGQSDKSGKNSSVGDGRLGYPADAPYKAIHVGAASPSIPQSLIEQLKPEGRLIIPVGPEGGEQHLMQIDKASDGSTTTKKLMSVIFVPLTDKKHQIRMSNAENSSERNSSPLSQVMFMIKKYLIFILILLIL